MRHFDFSVNGLRAIAVMAVIAFHFGIFPITGGFVGVDIFFVISGFVITSSILQRLENKNFSLPGYFKSRFYRIFPALLVTVFITLILNALVMFPADAERSAWHGLSAMAFISNFFFWKEVGYFDVDSSYKPFLHTWSLAVEWQFYMLWPLAVYILFLLKRYALYLLLSGIVFGVAVSGLFADYSNFVFYMMPLRGWEFAMGALIAFVPPGSRIRNMFPAVSAIIGFGAILASLIMFNEDTVFPGFAAFVPCFGAFVLLFFRRDYSEQVLSHSALQYLGRISYSLYLVHWPLLIIYQNVVFRPLIWADIVILVVATLLLSDVLFNSVEQSFRKPQGTFKKARFPVLMIFVVLSILCAWYTISTEGKTGRYGPKENAVINYFKEANEQYREKYDIFFPKDKDDVWKKEKHAGIPCLYDRDVLISAHDERFINCVQNNIQEQKDKSARIVVIGDSNGKNTFEAMSRAFPDIGFSMMMHPGCAAAASKECFPNLDKDIEVLVKETGINGIILSSRYSNQPIDAMGVTVAKLEKLKIPFLIIGATPTLIRNPDAVMIKKGVSLDEEEFKLPLDRAHYHGDIHEKDKELKAMATENGGFFFDKKSRLCPDNKCLLLMKDYKAPLFLDTNHLSEDGIGYLSEAFMQDKDVRAFLSE